MLCHERLLTWDIRPNEPVVIIGGYQGDTCAFILDRYPEAEIYTFEPQLVMYAALQKRFAGVPNIHIYPYALGTDDGQFPMVRAGSYFCSFVNDGPERVDLWGEMREFGAAMAELGIDSLAWLHLNIERYEYILLPHLIRSGWIDRIGQLLVTLHPTPLAGTLGAEPWEWITDQLSRSHHSYWSQRDFWAWSKAERTTVDMPVRLGLPDYRGWPGGRAS